MQHEHYETVAYEGRNYSRNYKHTHLFDHEAHTHPRAWTGASKNKTQHNVMAKDGVPVVQTVRTTITCHHS